MANDIHYSFKTQDIKRLIEKGATIIVASSRLKKITIPAPAGQHVAEAAIKKGETEVVVIEVTGEGYNDQKQLVARIEGCPCPPCNPDISRQFQ